MRTDAPLSVPSRMEMNPIGISHPTLTRAHLCPARMEEFPLTAATSSNDGKGEDYFFIGAGLLG